MDRYLHLLFQLPAIVAGTTMVSYLSPVKIPPRAMPLVMFLIGLIVLILPATPDLALALTLPAAWLSNYLGISFHSHEPLKVTLPEKLRLPKKITIQRFAAHAYPSPDDEAAGQEIVEDAGEHEDAPPTAHEAGTTVSTVKPFVQAI